MTGINSNIFYENSRLVLKIIFGINVSASLVVTLLGMADVPYFSCDKYISIKLLT